jgi:predicted nucleic acid-binding Zn ribbon protein
MEKIQNFIICRTCGKYVKTSKPVTAGYCGEFCAQKYGCCITCGKYIIKKDMYKEDFCSHECSLQYELKEPSHSTSVTRQIKAKVI